MLCALTGCQVEIHTRHQVVLLGLLGTMMLYSNGQSVGINIDNPMKCYVCFPSSNCITLSKFLLAAKLKTFKDENEKMLSISGSYDWI